MSRDDVGRLGGSHLAEEMRAIVPGYQSAAAIARRGARRASRVSGRRRRTAVMVIIITIIQYESHVDI